MGNPASLHRTRIQQQFTEFAKNCIRKEGIKPAKQFGTYCSNLLRIHDGIGIYGLRGIGMSDVSLIKIRKPRLANWWVKKMLKLYAWLEKGE
jgi:hypothetical protein